MLIAIAVYIVVMPLLVVALCGAAEDLKAVKGGGIQRPGARRGSDYSLHCLQCSKSLVPEDGTHLRCRACRGVKT